MWLYLLYLIVCTFAQIKRFIAAWEHFETKLNITILEDPGTHKAVHISLLAVSTTYDKRKRDKEEKEEEDALYVMFSDNKIPYPERPVNSISGHTLRRRERRLHHVEDIMQ